MWWQERFGLDGSSPVNRPPLPLAFAQKRPSKFHDSQDWDAWTSRTNMLMVHNLQREKSTLCSIPKSQSRRRKRGIRDWVAPEKMAGEKGRRE